MLKPGELEYPGFFICIELLFVRNHYNAPEVSLDIFIETPL
jgi:hypothetical protein